MSRRVDMVRYIRTYEENIENKNTVYMKKQILGLNKVKKERECTNLVILGDKLKVKNKF